MPDGHDYRRRKRPRSPFRAEIGPPPKDWEVLLRLPNTLTSSERHVYQHFNLIPDDGGPHVGALSPEMARKSAEDLWGSEHVIRVRRCVPGPF